MAGADSANAVARGNTANEAGVGQGTATKPPRRPMLAGLQIIRALATVGIIIHHVGVTMRDNGGFDPWWSPVDIISRGVELFFILSGFIIMYIHWDEPGEARRAKRYAVNRLLRILPAAIIVATGWFAVLVLAREMGIDVSSAGDLNLALWLSSALIFPMLVQPSPIVIWTLKHEILFYSLFVSRYLSRVLFLALMAGWIVLSLSFEPAKGDQFGRAMLLNINVMFPFGVAAFFVWRHTPINAWIERAGPGIVATLVTAIYLLLSYFTREDQTYEGSSPLLFGALGAVLLLTTIPLRMPRLPERVLVFLGDASYGTYLVHFPVIIVLYALLERFGLPDMVLYIILFGAGLGLGIVFYLLIEKPITKALRRRFSPRLAAAGPGAVNPSDRPVATAPRQG